MLRCWGLWPDQLSLDKIMLPLSSHISHDASKHYKYNQPTVWPYFVWSDQWKQKSHANLLMSMSLLTLQIYLEKLSVELWSEQRRIWNVRNIIINIIHTNYLYIRVQQSMCWYLRRTVFFLFTPVHTTHSEHQYSIVYYT